MRSIISESIFQQKIQARKAELTYLNFLLTFLKFISDSRFQNHHPDIHSEIIFKMFSARIQTTQ